jgi:hypothetical protein
MSKKTRTAGLLLICVGIAVAAIIFVAAVFKLSTRYLKSSDSGACSTKLASHTVIIQNDKVSPGHTQAKKCDTLTIINRDDKLRLMAFGLHDNHIPYDGVTESTLKKDGSLTVTLVQSGTFTFHDHRDEAVSGTFTATE